MLTVTRCLLTAATLSLTAPFALAQEATVATARGDVSLPVAPQVVAVLDIAALDTLQALGVSPDGVPVKLYVDYLNDIAASAKPIGTLFEPDLEALAELGPDLIIAGGRSASQVEALSPIATTIDMTISPDVIGDGRQRLASYGLLFDKADKAAELTAALDAKIAEAKAAVEGKGNALILTTDGPKVSAYGRGSRFAWLHETLGLPEARENLDPQTHGDAVSFEFIAQVNPDWIILIDRSAAVGEPGSGMATLDNPLVMGTTAGQKGQIVQLSGAPIYIAGGGYTSLMTTLDEVVAAFGG